MQHPLVVWFYPILWIKWESCFMSRCTKDQNVLFMFHHQTDERWERQDHWAFLFCLEGLLKHLTNSGPCITQWSGYLKFTVCFSSSVSLGWRWLYGTNKKCLECNYYSKLLLSHFSCVLNALVNPITWLRDVFSFYYLMSCCSALRSIQSCFCLCNFAILNPDNTCCSPL